MEKNHSVFISNDKTEITGINGILSFREDEIVLSTQNSALIIQGNGLKMDALDTENGRSVIHGTVNMLKYKKKGEKVGFLKKLTK